MKVYKAKEKPFRGTSYSEVRRKAYHYYQAIKSKSKRRPYVRSAYFKKEKVFIALFWSHLFESKNFWDQTRRMKFFACGMELIKYSHFEPISKENPNKPGEILHRFAGMSADNDLFFVQIKEDKRSGQKYLISVFPVEDK